MSLAEKQTRENGSNTQMNCHENEQLQSPTELQVLFQPEKSADGAILKSPHIPDLERADRCRHAPVPNWLSARTLIAILLLLLIFLLTAIAAIVSLGIVVANRGYMSTGDAGAYNYSASRSPCPGDTPEHPQCPPGQRCPWLNRTLIQSQYPRRPPRVKDVRLPTNIRPELYTLKMQVYIHMEDPESFFFNGSVRIDVTCLNFTNWIFIHSYKLLVNESLMEVRKLVTNELIPIDNITYDESRQWYHLELGQILSPGLQYTLVIPHFQAPLKRELKGWYLSAYEENEKMKYLATSQLQPTDARQVFPCMDEPAFKAKFQVTILRRKGFHSLANMPLKRTLDEGDDWQADEFEPSLTMSTYLLAFVVSEFKSLSGTDSKGRKFTVWSRPDIIDTAEYALDIGIKILEFFEKYFEIEYPLNKTDMIAVPDFAAGAMENWGLMIYREMSMLWDPKFCTAANKQKVATVISHEIAHQWFGNLVTLKWWDDLWLNEGFASFVEYVGVSHIHPDWLMDEQFALSELQKVLSTDALVTSHPVLMPVFHPDEINEIFDSISYNKGASVLRMMEAFLGNETFRKGLKRYLWRHRYNNTIHDDLWRSLTEQAAEDGRSIKVKDVMDSWIKQMGYPYVTVLRKGPKTFEITQEHFLINSTENVISYPSQFNFTWQIPLTYASKSNPNWTNTQRITWMNSKSISLEINDVKPDDWVLFNLQQAGFYRVNYDEENWRRLINQLQTDHMAIPSKNRAQLLDDLFNLGRIGTVNLTLFMNLTKYLRKETTYVPWEAANKIFAFLDSVFSLDEAYGSFQTYLRYLIDPIYRLVSWKKGEDGNHLDNLMRPIAVSIACTSGNEDCSYQARALFKQWMRNTAVNNIPTGLRPTVYCVGIRLGTLADWDRLHDEVNRTRHEEEINRIWQSLGCSQEVWILKRFIRIILDAKEMKSSEADDMLLGITRNPTGRFLLWDHLRTNWRNMTNEAKAIITLRKLFKRNGYIDLPMLDELNKFREHAIETGNRVNERIVTQAIEQAKQNMRWMDAHRDTIVNWLAQQVPLLVPNP